MTMKAVCSYLEYANFSNTEHLFSSCGQLIKQVFFISMYNESDIVGRKDTVSLWPPGLDTDLRPV